MLNIRKSLALVVLLSTYALTAQVAQQPVATSDIEQAKWATLQTVFATKLAASKTFMNKLGSGMKNHPYIFIIGIGICERVLKSIFKLVREEGTKEKKENSKTMGTSKMQTTTQQMVQTMSFVPIKSSIGTDDAQSLNDSEINELDSAINELELARNELKSSGRKLLGFVCLEAFCFACTKFSSWLEQEPARCKELLNDIAVHWQDYKADMPVVLHPLFEKIAADAKIHGKLTIINDSDACKLVESLMAMSVVLGPKN
jgi:hypothetical protein